MKTSKSILKGIVVGLVAGIIMLLAINSVYALPNKANRLNIPALPSNPLNIKSSVDEVLALMLESDQKWNSLTATYKLSEIDKISGEIHTQNQYFWLDKKGELARAEIDGEYPVNFVRGTNLISTENINKKIYFQAEIPDTFKYDSFNPRNLLLNASGAVYFHPYGRILPTGYYDFLYPTAIAQSMIFGKANGNQEIEIVGEDEVAGRDALIISRMPKNHLYWVDTITGVVLRAEYFEESDKWQAQFEAQSIIFDKKIPGSIFQFSPTQDSEILTPSEFYEQSQNNN